MTHTLRQTAVATAAGLAVLLLSAPSPRAALRSLADAGAGTDPTAPLVAAVALLAWAVAGWLALTVLVVLLSRVPGALGRTAGAAARCVAPTTVRRAVEVALGLTVAVGVVAPTAALAAPTPLATAAASAETAWDLDWPSSTVLGGSTPSGSAPSTSAPSGSAPSGSAPSRSTPSGSPSATAPSTTAPSTTAPAPVATTSPPALAVTTAPRARPTPATQPPSQPAARPAAPPAAARPSPDAPVATAVVVEPGDTLWSLAEASLRSTGTPPTDRQVAQAWPRWWAANREAVGDDPDLLLPGTVLRPPHGSAG